MIYSDAKITKFSHIAIYGTSVPVPIPDTKTFSGNEYSPRLFMTDTSDILRRCHARLFLEHPAEVLRILKA